jgi:hypothetical protein
MALSLGLGVLGGAADAETETAGRAERLLDGRAAEARTLGLGLLPNPSVKLAPPELNAMPGSGSESRSGAGRVTTQPVPPASTTHAALTQMSAERSLDRGNSESPESTGPPVSAGST